jgi:PAS domain S-box-containing protein
MNPPPPVPDRRFALRVSIGYAVFAAAWILASDRVLELLVADPVYLSRLQTAKGWLFVVITALLLYALAARARMTSVDSALRGSQTFRPRLAIGTAGSLLIAAVLANLVYSLWSEHADLIADGERTTRNLAQVLEGQTGGQINAVDLTLRAITREIGMLTAGAPHRAEQVDAVLQDNLRLLPFVRSLVVVDREGRLQYRGERTPAPHIDVSDRDYFRAQVDSNADRLFIGEPIVGRLDGRRVIGMSRRLVDAEGRFAGVVAASLEIEFLERNFAALEVGTSSSVALFNTDGVLLARSPPLKTALGRGFAASSPIGPMLQKQPNGTYHGKSVVDATERIFSYRRVAGRDLVVIIGVGKNDLLANWRLRAWTYGAVSTAFMLLVAWLSIQVVRELERHAQLNAALETSEQRFSRIFHANPAAQSIADIASGRYIDVNERCAELFGFSREKMIGRTSLELDLWADTREREALIARAVREGTLRDVPMRMRRADGHPLDILISVVVTRVGSHSEPVVITQFSDVSELLRTRAELEEGERRYRMLFENNPHAMWVYDATTLNFLAVNDEAVATYGYSREEFLSMSLPDIRRPEEREAFSADMRAIEASSPRRHMLATHVRKDGSLIDVDIVSHGLELSGRAVRLVLITDVTAKLAAERALSESERLNRAVLTTLEDGILLRDAECRVLLANPAAARMYASTVENMVGESGPIGAARFFFEDGRPQGRELAAWYNALKDGQPRQGFILRLVRHDGTEIWIEANAVPLFREGGEKPYAVVSKLTDITQRRAAEAEVKRLNAELEARVARRTAELQAANYELESFAYSVSHDLRAPLRHLDGFASLAREAIGDPAHPAQSHLTAVTRSARRMGALIDGLLALSRTGRMELKIADVPLDPLVADVREECERDAQGRRVEWRIGALPVVRGDVELLRQVFANLMGNAVKFTAGREVAVIEVFERPGAAVEAVIGVRDNGAGFDMRYAERLFGAFQRLHAREQFEGTGVGLATVKRIIERHGGRVWAEGEPGKGATFWFTLPRA